MYNTKQNNKYVLERSFNIIYFNIIQFFWYNYNAENMLQNFI